MNYIAENIDLIPEKLQIKEEFKFLISHIENNKDYQIHGHFTDIKPLEHSFNYFLQKLSTNDTKYLEDNYTVELKGKKDKTKAITIAKLLVGFEELMRSKKWKCKPFLIDLTVLEQKVENPIIYSLINDFMYLCCQYRCPCILIANQDLKQIEQKTLIFLAKKKLIKVRTLIPSLIQPICMILEPDQPGLFNRIGLLSSMQKKEVPTEVLCYPLIPFINEDELYEIAQLAASYGCSEFKSIRIRAMDFYKNLNIKYKRLFSYSDLKHCKLILGQLNHTTKSTEDFGLEDEEIILLENYNVQLKQTKERLKRDFFPKKRRKLLNVSANNKFKTDQLNLF